MSRNKSEWVFERHKHDARKGHGTYRRDEGTPSKISRLSRVSRTGSSSKFFLRRRLSCCRSRNAALCSRGRRSRAFSCVPRATEMVVRVSFAPGLLASAHLPMFTMKINRLTVNTTALCSMTVRREFIGKKSMDFIPLDTSGRVFS